LKIENSKLKTENPEFKIRNSDTYPILEKQTEDINRCFRCGLCKTVCPSFEELKLESSSPRGRVQLAQSVLTGTVDFNRAVESRMLDCLNCMQCAEICPSDVRTDRIVLAARAELAKRGRLNFVKKAAFKTVMRRPAVMNTAARAASYVQRWLYEGNTLAQELVPQLAGMEDKHFPVLSIRQTLSRWPEINLAEGTRKMRVAYFIGCATNLMFTAVADATIRVLTRNGVEVLIPRRQACCGIPVYSSGDYETAKKLATMNLESFSGLDVDAIVTDCSSCSGALKHDIDELFGAGRFEKPVYDLTEFLVNTIDIIQNSKFKIQNSKMRVTYHDPCHLRRGQGIFREPRSLLTMVPDVEFIEMVDSDRCCGGAGTFSYTHHDLSRKVGARKIGRIRDTEAEYVATPCPSCKMQLDDLIAHEGLSVRTIHPVEVLDAAYKK